MIGIRIRPPQDGHAHRRERADTRCRSQSKTWGLDTIRKDFISVIWKEQMNYGAGSGDFIIVVGSRPKIAGIIQAVVWFEPLIQVP